MLKKKIKEVFEKKKKNTSFITESFKLPHWYIFMKSISNIIFFYAFFTPVYISKVQLVLRNLFL